MEIEFTGEPELGRKLAIIGLGEREAKMAAHGGQFCTSVSVPYAGLYVYFSLPRDFLRFLKTFFEITRKTCLQNIEMSLTIWNIIRQSQIELQIIYFYENNLPNWRETS